MKRFHIHVAVDDLAANIGFYSGVFGQQPAVVKEHYAKWMLDDPRVNFAISNRGLKAGVDHLGIQVDSDEELAVLRDQVRNADIAARDQPGAACCYANSNNIGSPIRKGSHGRPITRWGAFPPSDRTPNR